VVEFMAGKLGEPFGGYPEPLRTHVLKGEAPVVGRPGASMPPRDLDALKKQLVAKHGGANIRDADVISAALYDKVFDEYRDYRDRMSDVSLVPTRFFLAPPEVGKEFSVEIERGKTLVVKLISVSAIDEEGHRNVLFELNGQPRRVLVRDRSVESKVVAREKADPTNDKSVGAPMPGTVVELRVAPGQAVVPGVPLVVLSAMKMEMVVASPAAGTVARIAVAEGDVLGPGDLLLELSA
jgi:pyruvate carboxylase